MLLYTVYLSNHATYDVFPVILLINNFNLYDRGRYTF